VIYRKRLSWLNKNFKIAGPHASAEENQGVSQLDQP
jgi:hypothetical protein